MESTGNRRFPSQRASNAEAPHYSDAIMGTVASQITSFFTVYSTVYSGADEGKHQSSASPVNSPHKWPVTRKMFPSDDVIMFLVTISSCEPVFHQFQFLKMPGYRSRVMVTQHYADSLLLRLLYLICGVCLLSWVYRRYFKLRTIHAHHRIMKVVGI